MGRSLQYQGRGRETHTYQPWKRTLLCLAAWEMGKLPTSSNFGTDDRQTDDGQTRQLWLIRQTDLVQTQTQPFAGFCFVTIVAPGLKFF